MDLRNPKEITVEDGDGKIHKFFISKMPAFEGFEIMARYPISLATSTIPKLSDWPLVADLQLKILKYVAVDMPGGKPLPLSTQALIDNHCADWEVMGRLLAAEVEYNNSFFRKGIVSNFFAEVALTIIKKISEILTQSSAQ